MGTGLYALQLYEEGAPPSVDVTGTSRDLAAMFSAILPAAPLRAGAWGSLAALAGAGAAERGAAPGWGARGIPRAGTRVVPPPAGPPGAISRGLKLLQ